MAGNSRNISKTSTNTRLKRMRRELAQDIRFGTFFRKCLTRVLFALLVITAEDETAEGSMRARQNVVHELGLFQGRLGFSRAIAIVEEGVEMSSNMDSIQQIRFGPGNIRESFGEVVATLEDKTRSRSKP